MAANRSLARLSLDATALRLRPVTSAISSYGFSSSHIMITDLSRGDNREIDRYINS